jgi:hypothetical protein
MKTNIIAIVFSLFAVSGTAALAQEYAGSSGAAIRQGSNGTPVIQHHASTLEEGVLRGGADLLRGIGDMNYSNSLASINTEVARGLAIQNAKQGVQTWFDIRAINRESRAATQKPHISAADAARLARQKAPRGLTAMEFDTTTGKLIWPVALQTEDYDAERATIDSLVNTHGVEVREVKILAGKLDSKLKGQIRELPTSEYIAAKRFLSGLQADAAYGPSVASR